MLSIEDVNKLLCTNCGSKVHYKGTINSIYLGDGVLKCAKCKLIFAVQQSIPNMVLDDFLMNDKFKKWKQKLSLLPLIRKELTDRKKNLQEESIAKDYYEIIDFVQFKPGSVVLDIGCKDCAFGKYLDKSIIYWAIDPLVIESQFSNYSNYKFIRANGEMLPFKSEIFDYIIIKDTINYFYDLELLIQKIRVSLKKNGIFIIFSHGNYEVNNYYRKIRSFLRKIVTHLLGYLVWEDIYIQVYDKKEILKVLLNNNFSIRENEKNIQKKKLLLYCEKSKN